MARVLLTPRALADLDRLIADHGLPADARQRVQRSLRVVERFPRAGRELTGRWAPLRFVLGPWSWMVLVYVFDEDDDAVFVVTVQDGRGSSAPTFG